MNINTWVQRLQFEALKVNWNHVVISVGDRIYFMNLPIVWDGNLKVGEMILETDTDAQAAAKRSAESQA